MKLSAITFLSVAFAANVCFALDPHVEAVIRTVEGAKGRVEKTGDGQSLKLVDLAVPQTGPHDQRKDDPYDAAFFEHLGHLTTLESLNVISTKANDEWIAPLGRLTNLKSLRFTNNGRLTDAGMGQLAGAMKGLEGFAFVGTAMTGRAYAQFDVLTKLVRVTHRGSSIDDEGLKELCAHLPNLEYISLAHAKITDAGAPNLAKLTKLKGLDIGSSKATPDALVHITKLPLEFLELGDNFATAASIPVVTAIATLRRVTIPH
ncbi:MAG: G protein-coupled receptor LGR4, partial [Chthoniobacterales bacterium]|nr:G protein-coupled receptor LGR4 [Chthoniobacterales bacterium]